MKLRSTPTLILGLSLAALLPAGCATSPAPDHTPVAAATPMTPAIAPAPTAPAVSQPGAEALSPLAGKWTIDVARSSPIRPWDKMAIEISSTGDTATVIRHLAWGDDRRIDDTTTVKTDGQTVTANPVTYWLDTWYTNVYIGGDHQKHVTGEWLDGGRVLKLETKLKLEGQQGDHPVHIYDEYRLSADGRTLKLYELRSTRDEALVYMFTRQ